MNFNFSKKNNLKQIAAGTIIVLAVVFAVYYWNDIFKLIKDTKHFESWISGFGLWGFLIFILMQVLQVIIFFIPAAAVQVAGGYLYGTVLGSLLSIVGIILGSMICFTLAKILGQPLVERALGKAKMDKLKKLINNRKSKVTLFVLFLIPGFPKDALNYVAGLTPIRFGTFLAINLIARSPAIVGASFIGAKIKQRDYSDLIIASIILAIVFVFAIFKRNDIIKFISERSKKSKKVD